LAVFAIAGLILLKGDFWGWNRVRACRAQSSDIKKAPDARREESISAPVIQELQRSL
jgi:hypothetical protein